MSTCRGSLVAGCLTLSLLGGAAAPARGVEASGGGPAAQVEQIARTAESLRQAPVEDMNTDVPDAVRPLLTRLKHELLDLVVQHLAVAGGRPAAALRARLVAELRRAGARLDSRGRASNDNEEAGHRYGDVVELQIEQPRAHPGILTVAITLGVMCGTDTSLYVFRREASGWQLILTREADGYATVEGAQNLFDYQLSAPEPGGGFFVATASINAWCTSNWQSIRLEVLRPGPRAGEPKVLLAERQSVFGQDYRLKVLGRGVVSLAFQGNRNLGLDDPVREHVLRYQVAGDRVARIPPLARRPADFLDEWVDLPWPQAREWSAPELEPWHSRLQRTGNNYTLKDPGLRSAKAGRPGRWWVQLCLDGKDLPPALYFLVSREGERFRLEEVRARQPRGLALDEAEICESGEE